MKIDHKKLVIYLSLAVCSVSVGYAQTAGSDPGDYAYDLAQRLHDANGSYCAKALTIKEARFLTQYYGAHKNDPVGENCVILSTSEIEAAKSMAKGKCQEPTAVPTAADSNATGPRTLAKSSPAPTTVSASGSAQSTPTPGAVTKNEKAHVIRIGIASPDAQIGQGGPMGSVAEPIKTMMIQYLNGPGLEIVPMLAMLPAQIEAEAKEKTCDYVLYSSVTQKKSGMSFLKAATLASSLTPIGAMAGATRAATAAAGTATATQAATVSSAIRAKTEYTLTYKLLSGGNSTPVLTNSLAAKAKSDGEDVITPLIQQAATAILGQVQTKR